VSSIAARANTTKRCDRNLVTPPPNWVSPRPACFCYRSALVVTLGLAVAVAVPIPKTVSVSVSVTIAVAIAMRISGPVGMAVGIAGTGVAVVAVIGLRGAIAGQHLASAPNRVLACRSAADRRERGRPCEPVRDLCDVQLHFAKGGFDLRPLASGRV